MGGFPFRPVRNDGAPYEAASDATLQIVADAYAGVDLNQPTPLEVNESGVGSLSLGALNAATIIDMAGYETLSFNINNMPASTVVSVTASQDGLTNWQSIPADSVGAVASNVFGNQLSSNGQWTVQRRTRYVKLEVTAYGGSGTVQGTITLSSATYAQRQVAVVGLTADDAQAVGNPLPVRGKVQTGAITTLVANDGAELRLTTAGQLVVKDNAPSELEWTYAAQSGGITGTADVQIKGAAPTGLRNYLTDIDVVNTHATVDTEVVVKDGATIIWRRMVKAGASVTLARRTPLKGTAVTALNVACLTTGAQVYVNAAGYVAP